MGKKKKKKRPKSHRPFMPSIHIQPTGSLLPTVISLGCQLPKLHYVHVCDGIFKLNMSYFTYRRTLRQAVLLLFIKIMQTIAPTLTGNHTSKAYWETDTAPQWLQPRWVSGSCKKILSYPTESTYRHFQNRVGFGKFQDLFNLEFTFSGEAASLRVGHTCQCLLKSHRWK